MRILRGLTSRLLPCGCVAGVYETYDGAVVTLLDERAGHLPDPRPHEKGTRFARSRPSCLRSHGPNAARFAHADRPRLTPLTS